MNSSSIGLRAFNYHLPSEKVCLEELQEQGKLSSDPETLRALGWRYAHVAKEQDAFDLASHAVEGLLAGGFQPESIDVLIYCGATVNSFVQDSTFPDPGHLWDFFKYPANRIQDRWGMTRATVFPLAQQGCVTLLAGIRLARDILRSEPEVQRVLCVSADVLPAKAPREVLFNVLSDGSCAVLVEKDCSENDIIAIEQVTKGYYWDPEALQLELMASYFPTARNVLLQTLEKANMDVDQLRWLVPHNVSMQSWRILLSLLKWPESLLYKDNISEKGHTIAADNFINLQDLLADGLVQKGDYLLLFSFGFGASWTTMLLRH